ncbi:hypothetical protein [Hyphobacterium sp.]|uniref:SDH family Clp fold serine proteinase n=1 Tax=Hyphobacterium sp. TaxID=2004662 RepID=UPI0037488120
MESWVYIGIAVILVVLTAIGAARSWASQKSRADVEDILSRQRASRQRDYDAAKKDLEKAQKEIEKSYGNGVIIVDLICDINDGAIDRDAPKFISYQQAVQAQQLIDAWIGIKRRHPTLVVLMHTLGGYSQPAQLIASAVASYPGPKVCFVPYIAMSGGTKIALACEKIHLGNTGVLGPTDTQFYGHSYVDLQRVTDDDKRTDLPAALRLATFAAEKYDKHAVEQVTKVTHPNHNRGDSENVGQLLSSGKYSHSHSIYFEEAKRIGLNVDPKIPKAMRKYVDARIKMIDTKIEQELQALFGPATPPPTPNDEPEGGMRLGWASR